MDKQQWIVYLIQCDDDSLYCGITNDLKERLAAHNSGKGAKYTRSRRPVNLVSVSSEMTKSDALKLEYRIKQVPTRKKKAELTKWEGKMTTSIVKELQAINKDLKIISRKVEKMIAAAGKAEKVKPKTAKAKSSKKVAPKTDSAKKSVAKKPAPKKATRKTAADTVFDIIKRYKRGVNTATLVKRTGYTQKKVFNIVYKLKTIGKIKSAARGVYIKA